MGNIEYSVNEQAVDEQGSSFDLMNEGNSVSFSDYVDPRDGYYFESTVSDIGDGSFESTIMENNGIDDYYDDDLEKLYNNTDEYDSKYVRMKKYNKKSEGELGDISSATKNEVSSVLNNDKDETYTNTIKMDIADTLGYYSEAA